MSLHYPLLQSVGRTQVIVIIYRNTHQHHRSQAFGREWCGKDHHHENDHRTGGGCRLMTQNRSRAQQGWCWCCRLTGDTEVTRGDVLVGGASVQAGVLGGLEKWLVGCWFRIVYPLVTWEDDPKTHIFNRGWSQLLDCLWEYSLFHIIADLLQYFISVFSKPMKAR